MNKKQEEGIDRNWHPEFQKYTEAIVSAPEYEGLYFERKKDTQIKWVTTKKSSAGQKRLAWWNKKCEELGIPVKSGKLCRCSQGDTSYKKTCMPDLWKGAQHIL